MGGFQNNHPVKDEDKIRAEERVRLIGLLLLGNSPHSLLYEPQFIPLAVTQEEIDDALARAQKKTNEPPDWYVVSESTREKIKGYRLLDDLFMREVLKDNIPGVQDIVRVVLENDNIEVVELRVDESYPNVRGHGVRFDVLAKDGDGNLYNIEIQRDKRGATPKRARFYHAAIDWNHLKTKKTYDELTETWVIFITEERVFSDGEPIFPEGKPYATVDHVFRETGRPFRDGQHVRYVDASYVGADPIGKLMADFRQTEPEKMFFPSLAEPAKKIKRTESGERKMGSVIEELLEEGREEGREEGIGIGREEGIGIGRKEGEKKGREEERVRTVGLLLAMHSPETLLHAPQFQPFGYTQADIDAALAQR